MPGAIGRLGVFLEEAALEGKAGVSYLGRESEGDPETLETSPVWELAR